MIKSKPVFLACLFLLAGLALGGWSLTDEPCHVKADFKSPYTWKPNVINGPIPASFHWGNVNGVNFLSQLRNQHIPYYCGACWAFASTSVVSDRINIMRGGKWPEVNIAPQVLLSCNQKNNGCHGGSCMRAYQWMNENDISDESCSPYSALSWTEGLVCDKTAICKECFSGESCFQPATFNKYRVGEYALLPESIDAMKNEIMARGPISCAVNAGPLVGFTGTGVFTSDDEGGTNHAISVVGWGVTSDNIPYWVMRNSWGEYWGDNGFAKILMGKNTIQIESYCTYAVPVKTWQDQSSPADAVSQIKKPNLPKQFIANSSLYKTAEIVQKGCVIDHTKKMVPLIKSPLPQNTLSVNALPADFWWGNNDDVNYLSWQVNQHLPHYCGSCWGQAAASSLADRINIMRNNAFPRVALSVQVLLNCFAEGTCNGGWGGGPYTWGHKHGIPEVGCQQYIANDPSDYSCPAIHQCMDCKRNEDGSQNCWAVTNFNRWWVKEYGTLRGIDNMKKEIFARGPISCSMYVTDKFLKEYTGGIYSEAGVHLFPNHYVSVNGWGKDATTGQEYWIVRNSWGSHYGENGFFRIKMGSDNLGIDKMECFWGVPSDKKSYDEDMELGLVQE